MNPVLEMRAVKFAFDEKKILDGVSLTVRKGERLVVLGQSGSGKSTILRLILGTLRPRSGAIFFQNENLTLLKRRALNRVRSRIGMVYQYAALISSLNVRDNLALPLEELTDKPRAEIEAIVDEKLALVELGDAKEKMPAELSGGMKKRIGIARALVHEPELILFDEPSAGLDPVTAAVIDDLILDLSKKTGATAVIVTHLMHSALKIATQMAMLEEGKIVAEGTPDEMRDSSQPAVVGFLEATQDERPAHEHARPHSTPATTRPHDP